MQTQFDSCDNSDNYSIQLWHPFLESVAGLGPQTHTYIIYSNIRLSELFQTVVAGH